MNLNDNPLARRVQGGTTQGNADVCVSCRYAIRRQGAKTGLDETRCGALANAPLVREQLAACSMYLDKGRLSLDEMGQIAWVIETKGKHIGFLSPEALERRRQNQPPPNPVGF